MEFHIISPFLDMEGNWQHLERVPPDLSVVPTHVVEKAALVAQVRIELQFIVNPEITWLPCSLFLVFADAFHVIEMAEFLPLGPYQVGLFEVLPASVGN